MSKIGFEFEFLSKLYDDEILDDLGYDKYDMMIDPSVKFDKFTLMRDGWKRWELITSPESPKKALNTLREVQSYLIDTGARTNNSCGFHVNVSATNMSKFDPMTLIAVSGENFIGNTFNRFDNKYCTSWAKYFNDIVDLVNKKSKSVDRIQKINDNITEFVDASAYGYELCEVTYPYAWKVTKDSLVDKYTSINVSKLALGYIEFRMIGGANYHTKMLESFVLNLLDSTKYAAKGRNEAAIKEYLSQFQ